MTRTEISLPSQISEANRVAMDRILTSEATLADIKPAIETIPGFKNNLITHAGPPIQFEKMCKPQRLGVLNLIIYEGLADTAERAQSLIKNGEVIVSPNHGYGNVSGMCGVTSATMPVFVIENKVHGNTAYNWQQTDVTAFGAKYEKVEEIEFIKEILAPVMKATIKESGGIDIKPLVATGLQMGDDLHTKFDATRGAFINTILPHIVKTDFPKDTLARVGDYFLSNQGKWYCGNLMIGACKVMMDVARSIRYSTIVTAMSRNGIEFGIQVSGLGDKWFTGPAGEIRGATWPGFSQADSTLDIGDSAIIETRGLGGTAMPASPVQAKFLGEGLREAVSHTKSMFEVSISEDPYFRIPYMDFSSVPVGIDIRKVVATGILPKINTGMAHKDGGFSIIGAGIATAPMEPFAKALEAFGVEYQ